MEAWRRDSGTNKWDKFNYTEPMANHNTSKHCADDVNNRMHAPIGLQDIWATKRSPHHQFTFICSVADVNANNSIACATNTPAMYQVKFRKLLSEQMTFNKLTEF